jgi:hypothetical protein
MEYTLNTFWKLYKAWGVSCLIQSLIHSTVEAIPSEFQTWTDRITIRMIGGGAFDPKLFTLSIDPLIDHSIEFSFLTIAQSNFALKMNLTIFKHLCWLNMAKMQNISCKHSLRIVYSISVAFWQRKWCNDLQFHNNSAKQLCTEKILVLTVR